VGRHAFYFERCWSESDFHDSQFFNGLSYNFEKVKKQATQGVYLMLRQMIGLSRGDRTEIISLIKIDQTKRKIAEDTQPCQQDYWNTSKNIHVKLGRSRIGWWTRLTNDYGIPYSNSIVGFAQSLEKNARPNYRMFSNLADLQAAVRGNGKSQRKYPEVSDNSEPLEAKLHRKRYRVDQL